MNQVFFIINTYSSLDINFNTPSAQVGDIN